MSIAPNSPRIRPLLAGSPCWVELPVPDIRSAVDFYTGLFGWHYTDDDGYTVAMVDGIPVAGLPQSEAPGPWRLYLLTPHARATAEKAFHLGGSVLRNPEESADHTQSTLITDPTGAVVGFRHVPPDWRFGTDGHGAFAWAELNTRDGAAADTFFRDLCHYDMTQIGDGHRLDYVVYSVEGQDVVGRQRMGREFQYREKPHWMIYFNSAPEIDIDAVATRVLELGGRVTVEPYDTPFGRITTVEDHNHMAFSVVDQSRAIEAEPRAEVDDPYDD
ncbi:glyoxalase [Lentzea sp. NBRC 105346]|uniref:VOC family protein n=1 Tax=Lentzea sp. NBRC 105346 TaxID=3032205 RepID=UPI00249FCA47|nr:VOC family protein [Lentzea sp. NBRC 105346]GLZ31306.1 glyoxalase [Lentzea sp. NBRC 105346]